MSSPASGAAKTQVTYPDSDGQPMADNTAHFDFIHMLKGNLDILLPDFVAGDHLWYPVEGHPEIRVAPDVYVAMGRPKGYRGSYKQWEEDGVPLQVVFEWWSPKNSFTAQAKKLLFYQSHGVEESYTFDQRTGELAAFHRNGGSLEPVNTEGGVTSPLLGFRFAEVEGVFKGWDRDGKPFLSMSEMKKQLDDAEQQRAEAEQQRAEAEQQRAEAEAQVAALQQKLRDQGIDPEA